MKILKRVLIGLVALVALLLVIGLFLPSKWAVERSITVAATPEAITPLIATPRRWREWAAWNNEMDPTMVTTYGGPESGAGASMSWTGETMGTGTLTIASVTPGAVTYDMVMEGSETPSHGAFTLAVEGDKTRVTWRDEGDMGMFLPGRYFVPIMESMLGEHFEIGLQKLQPLAEAAAKGAAGGPARGERAEAAASEAVPAG